MTDSTPKISLIVPVYNTAPFLAECLDSLAGQTLREIEIICVDDGSTDGSSDILQEYARRDPRFKVFHQVNQGAGVAQNTGLKAAAGEYVAFVGSDDLYPDPAGLARLYRAAKDNGAPVCGGGVKTFRHEEGKRSDQMAATCDVFDREGWVDYRDYQRSVLYVRYIFQRELVIGHSLFFPPTRRGQDALWCIRTLCLAGRFYAIRDLVYAYRVRHKPSVYNYETSLDMLESEILTLRFAHREGLDRIQASHEYQFLGFARQFGRLDPDSADFCRHYYFNYGKYYFLKFTAMILPGPAGGYFKKKYDVFKERFKKVHHMRLY